MKKTVSVVVLFAFIFSAFIPSFAQRVVADSAALEVRARNQFGEIRALTDGDGVLVRWEMKSEVANAGFFVYRVGRNGEEIVNPLMVVGSWPRKGAAPLFGETYQIFDPQGQIGSKYVIESRAINGRRLRSKAVNPAFVKDLQEATGTSTETLQTAALSDNGNVEEKNSSLTTELADIVQSAQQTPDLINHRWVVAQPGVKIAVRKEGFYRVAASELLAAGFSVGGNSANWRLFLDGVEQSIIVGPSAQYIEFYGKGIDTPESDTRIYYLISGLVAGKRIATRIIRSTPGFATANNYPVTTLKKERTQNERTLFNGDEENYVGRFIQSEPGFPSVPFTLTGIDFASQNARIIVKIVGFSPGAHAIRLIVNGHEIPRITGTGYNNLSITLTIPTAYLVEGSNALEMIASGPSDFNFFDSVAVKFARKFQTEQGRISFFTPGYKKVDVTGFTSPNVRIFDTTFDGEPSLIGNLPVVQQGSSFTVNLPPGRSIVAYGIEDVSLLVSPAVTRNRPSMLSTPTNAADLVIISYSQQDFLDASEVWADYRRSQGFTVRVIDVADIYDEFNFGVFGSAGIKSFLNYAHNNWQTNPDYILLMGDGSRDPRNYEGFGYLDFMPSKSVTLLFEEGVSDEALGDFDNDGLAEMAIGRIPARDGATITTAFNKTTTFETSGQQTLTRGALFAHDLPIGFDFAGMSQTMASELPPSMPVAMVDRATPTAQADLINQMNAGKFVINYSGHGSTGVWASSGFFSSASVSQLTNAQSPSIYNMLTCLNGYFLRPEFDSLAELLLKSQNGGAVASWASTSETTPDIQLTMGTRFFNQMAAGNISRMGDLIRDAKVAVPGGADVRLSWVLLGDPMLKVR